MKDDPNQCDDDRTSITSDGEPSVSGDEEAISDSKDWLPLGRREFIGIGLGAAASTAVPGITGAATSRRGITFDRVLNAVDDLGMDPTGQEPIDDILRDHWTDGTLIEFPPGTYMNHDNLDFGSIQNRGLVGLGDHRNDVEITSPAYGEPGYRDNHIFLKVTGGSGLLLENYTLQQGSEHDGRHSGHTVIINDDFKMVDVELAGFNPIEDGLGETDADAGPHPFGMEILDRDGEAVVKRYVRAGGGVADDYPHRRGGILVSDRHEGEVRFVDCYMAEGGSHTIYGSHQRGCVRIEGGLYENNDNTNLRIAAGKHPDKQSWVKDATIVIDTDEAEHLPDWGGGYDNTKGLEIEAANRTGHDGLLIEDVDIVCRSTPSSQGLVRVHDHGSVTFRNLRVENHVDNVPLFEGRATIFDSSLETDPTVEFDNCHFYSTGSMSNSWLQDGVFLFEERDGSTIRNSTVYSEGGDDPGIVFEDSQNCAVEDTSVTVPGEAVVSRSSSVTTSNLVSDGASQLADSTPTWVDGVDPRVDSGDGSSDGSTNGSPTASFTTTVSDLTVSVDASGSTDTDGSISAYEWSFDGTTETGQTQTHTFDAAGDYDVTLTVTDDDGASDSTTQTVSVTEPAPDLPHTLTIEGTGTQTNYAFTVSDTLVAGDDTESWDVVDGTSADGWVTDTTHRDSFAFDGTVESFAFREGEATVAIDGQELTVAEVLAWPESPNDGPTASFTASTADLTVSVDASGSTDTDGSISAYEWSFDGTTETGQTQTHTFDAAGDYDVTLTVTDDDGASDTTTRTVTVTEPAPDLPHTLTIEGTGTQTNYAFTVSDGLSGTSNTESWDVVDGTSADGWVTDTTHTDTFRFDGTVESFAFREGEATVAIDGQEQTVAEVLAWPEAPNDGPTASFTTSTDDLTVSVDASGSTDTDGSISAYEWSFGGATKTGQTQTHTFDAAGDYDVTLTVTDDDGASDSTTQTVSVTEPPLPNSVVFDGTTDSEATDYQLTVSGEVEADESADDLETGDTATDGTISGSVAEDLDSFRFSGDIVDLSVTGNARIVLVQRE